MKKTVSILLSVLAISLNSLHAQGVNFRTGLTWVEALAKAKVENKYIFVDCFATWCGPCKHMDNEVYPAKAVGDIYNAQFICIRLQMDKTSHDNADVQRQYVSAAQIESFYAINAYPTFLFFDERGNPVHKAVGYTGLKQFIRLASDAKNLDKQYYRILKNFQPNQIDTAEEKGLAYSFADVDPGLAGKLAVDYLLRIPKDQLNRDENGQLMFAFQNKPEVLKVTTEYLSSLMSSHTLNKEQVDFMASMQKQTVIQELVTGYLTKLSDQELGNEVNMRLLIFFNRTTKVAKLAKSYIGRFREDSLYAKDKLPLISAYLFLPNDRGFREYFYHSDEVDAIMGRKGYAGDCVESAITRAELDSPFNTAKRNGTAPDFDAISTVISQKYNSYYASRIIANGKVGWYKFLVSDKGEMEYWPQFNSARIAQMELVRPDTSRRNDLFTNNVCYNELFIHCENQQELTKAVGWMKNVTDRTPESAVMLDTYAVLLYKSGKTSEGISLERKALDLAIKQHSQHSTAGFSKTIEKMKQGEKIWDDKDVTD
jgi:thioredoxin-related protein